MAKVFISHSSRDKDIVCLFKDLILKSGLGLSDGDIFFTSSSETGVPIGGNIPAYIKEHLKDCEFVFLMISENYKRSEVCLNEMGAAMVHTDKLFPIILYNFSFQEVGWLIDRTLCVRIDDEERLDEIRDIFYRSGVYNNTSTWNRYRREFVQKIHTLVEGNKDILVKGKLDFHIEIFENQQLYAEGIEQLNALIPRYNVDAKYLIELHNSSSNLHERKNILLQLSEVLKKWADEVLEIACKIETSLKCSLKAVDDVLNIATLSTEERAELVEGVAYFLSQCKKNHEVLQGNRAVIESLDDVEKNQISAKYRLLSSYDSMLITFHSSIENIERIIARGNNINP